MTDNHCQCVMPQPISDSVAGEIICKNCGVILESRTIGHTETNEKNTTSRHDYGIGTEPPKIKLSHKSSHKISQRESNKDKRTKELFIELHPILQKISATSAIKDESYHIARECIKNDMIRGRRKTDVATACVIVSCKINGKSMSESEIITISNASKKTTRRVCRIILQTFDVNVVDVHTRTINMINRICSDLNISQKIMMQSLKHLEILKQKDTSISSHPGTVAATMVYLSCEKGFSQGTIAKIAGITEVSLRNFLKKLHNKDLSIIQKVT